MNNIKTEDKVFDTTGIINKGLPVQVTKIDGDKITVEFFEGDESVHRIIEADLNILSKIR